MINNKLGPAGRTVNVLIDRSYPVVKEVYLHLDEIGDVQEKLPTIDKVANNLEEIQKVQDAADRLIKIGDHMDEVLEVQDHVDSIEVLAPHVGQIDVVAENIQSVVDAKANADRAQEKAEAAEKSAGEAEDSAELARKWAIHTSKVEGNYDSSRTYALQAEASKTKSAEILKENQAVESYLKSMESTYKAVEDNEEGIKIAAGNINSINNVASDLKGEMIDDMSRDLGMIGDDDGSDHTAVTGGNIKKVADDIESVRTVAGNIDDVNTVADAIESLPEIKQDLDDFVKQATAQADRSEQQANASQTSAEASEASAKRAEVVLRQTREEGEKQVGLIQAEGATQIQAVKDQGTTTTAEVVAEGTKQFGLVQAKGDEELTILNGIKSETGQWRDTAKDWAIKLDAPVEGEEYSSKHWAQKSAQSASASQTSAEASEASNQASAASAAASEESHQGAVTKAQEASASAQSASQSAATAQTQATAATEAKTASETARDAAKASETKAKVSETASASAKTAAESARDLAQGYANQAKASASTATTKASEASQSATSASGSATTAANKAKEASDSAAAAKASETNAAQSAAEALETKTSALQEIETKKTEAVQAVQTQQTSSIQAVSEEGTKHIGLVQAKGEEAVGTIASNVETTNQNAQKAEAQAQEAQKQAEIAKGYADQAASGQLQADWNETNPSEKTYIKNKPDIYTKTEVDAKLVAVFVYKGSVDTETSLPAEGNQIGWVYNVNDTGANYAWNGTAWDDLGRNIDLAPYALKTEVASTYATKVEVAKKAPLTHTHTTAQVTGLDSALAGKAPLTHTHTSAQITDLNSTLAPYALSKTVTAELAKKADLTAIADMLSKTEASSLYLPVKGKAQTAGTADVAVKLQTARTITLGSKAAGSVSFDGSANVTLNVTQVTEAGKATNDSDGHPINTTYRKKSEKLTLNDFSAGIDLGMIGES